MKARRPGLVMRLVFVVVLSGAVAAVLGTLLLSAAARNTLRADVEQRSVVVSQELASRLDGRLVNAHDTLRLVAADDEIVRLEPDAAAHLRSVLRTSTIYDELVLFDRDGVAVAAAANAFAAEVVDQPQRADVASAAAGADYVGLVDAFPPVLELAVPVENPPGTAAGVLLARLPLEVLALPIHQRDTRSGMTSFLVGADGTVLVHPERDRMVARERFPIHELAAGNGVATLAIDGERVIAAAAPVRTLEGSVVLVQDETFALRPVARRLGELVAILVAVLAATMLAVSVAGERLLHPLSALADAVNRLGHGERGVRAGVRGAGEIAVLAREFDRMSETLDRRDAQLDELQRLSLLVNAAVDRDGLADDLVKGSQALLGAEAAAFAAGEDGSPPEVMAVAGTLDETSSRALFEGCPDAEPAVGHAPAGHTLTVRVTTLTGATLGILAAVRRHPPFDGEELRLATAFAAFAGVALDNARRLQLEQALVSELQDSVERRRTLISGVTHEFRTPLTCIEGFSFELLERWTELSGDERDTLLKKIHSHATELDGLVTRLLEFAATERGRILPSLSVVQLPDAVDQELRALAPLLADRPVRVDVPDLKVLADTQLLRSILTNLVSNAAKYSPPGTPVTIRAQRDGEAVRIDVEDEGIGMSPDEVELAFQPFWRAPGVRSERGTGLGLALVAEYLRAMNGALAVSSEPGRGSTFSFTLHGQAREGRG